MKKYIIKGLKIVLLINCASLAVLSVLMLLYPEDAFIGLFFFLYFFYLPVTYLFATQPIIPTTLGTVWSTIIVVIGGVAQHLVIGMLIGIVIGLRKQKN